jgi:hypothetical protein
MTIPWAHNSIASLRDSLDTTEVVHVAVYVVVDVAVVVAVVVAVDGFFLSTPTLTTSIVEMNNRG